MAEQVFMCYAREDEDFVLKLAGALKQRGVPIWIDQWDIPGSADWDEEVERALAGSSHLVVVLSPASMKSREVRGEWRAALDDGKPVVPVLLQECRIHRLLRLIQYVDFTSRKPTDADAVGEVIRALGMEKRTREQKEKPSGEPQQVHIPAGVLARYLGSQAKDTEGAALRVTGTRPTSPLLRERMRRQGLQYTPVSQKAVAQKKEEETTASKKVEEPETEFYERPWWWAYLAIGLGAGIGGEFLIDWLLRWVLGMLDLELPTTSGSWLALLLGGLLWGLILPLYGALEDPDPADLLLVPVLAYGDLLDGYDLGERLRGLLCAWPICFLVSWGGANGLAVAAGALFDMDYGLVLYLAFGLLSLLSALMHWLTAEEYTF